jgi:putative heme-binding domain-containing protein
VQIKVNSQLQWIFVFFVLVGARLQAQEAAWIWSPEHPAGQVPIGDAYFRKVIQLPLIEQARIDILADDTYELFVNGRAVGRSETSRTLDQYEISRKLTRGRNVIAVRVGNRTGRSAGVAIRVQIKPTGQEWRNFPTDESWKSSLDAPAMWQSVGFNDATWKSSKILGRLGQSDPSDEQRGNLATPSNATVGPAELPTHTLTNGYVVPRGFVVEQILKNDQSGSLLAIAFNEFGHIIASREGGSLSLMYDTDKDGIPDKVREYGDSVKNIQGILPLNGELIVTGDGPDGNGLYRLADSDRNGTLDETHSILKFAGTPGEHGAHQITLGPDGYIYVVLGNHVHVESQPNATSSYQNYYEGDLVQPRMEDPGGHARGIKAPGGTIIRVDIAHGGYQTIAGGIRNAYDLAFHPNGSLFVHDSDMEADVGALWYQPTRVFEVPEAAEFGWRSGWANWPAYYLDRLPSLVETGRGSPTGMVVYDHYAFPTQYQKSIFLADWSEGRILSLNLNQEGAGYRGQAEVFLRGQPLNVTDLEVAPDGSLYFCTGGRGTTGGIYRVVWKGDKTYDPNDLGEGIARAIRQPQLNSAWGRQQVAILKKEIGSTWDELVMGVAYSPDNPARYRVRALELMQLLGPTPTSEMIVELSRSPNESVRVKATRLLGLKRDDEVAQARLEELLGDTNRLVQRTACESLLRSRSVCEPKSLVPLLESDDTRLAFSARKVLETIDTEQWRDAFLNSQSQRLLIQAGLALVTVEPTQGNSKVVIEKMLDAMDRFVSDHDFIDMLRVIQVTLHRSGLKGDDVQRLRDRVSAEFPAGESILNRELIRLAVYLQVDGIVERAIAFVNSTEPLADRMLVGMHLTFLKREWSSTERFALLKFFEEALRTESGSSYPLYILNATQDFASNMTPEEARIFISDGTQWPNAAFVGLTCLPEKLTDEDLQLIQHLDKAVDQSGLEPDSFKRLKTAVTAVLARSGDAQSMSYLREIWRRSPDRRSTIAMGLAQQPGGENWDYLVRSIPILEPFSASEILTALTSVPDATDEPEVLRQVLLHAVRMQREGEKPDAPLGLLKHWLGKSPAADAEDNETAIAAWQNWYAETYPEHTAAVLPPESDAGKWTMDQLNEFLDGIKGKAGDKTAGLAAYEKARCASCHVMNGKGTALGPDLTSIAKRFTRQEMLESILFPSHVISDQYATRRILTTGGEVHVGLVSNRADGSISIRRSDLSQVVVPAEDIEDISVSKTSLMPSGLFDNLSLFDIRDMLSYLGYLPDAEQVNQANRAQTTIK